jgi:hypothetical protein
VLRAHQQLRNRRLRDSGAKQRNRIAARVAIGLQRCDPLLELLVALREVLELLDSLEQPVH